MKRKRQRALLNIINTRVVRTQEELIELLLAQGFAATQATVSRDLRELNIRKVRVEDTYRYAVVAADEAEKKDTISDMFLNSIKSVTHAENLIVVKTAPGMAMAVGAGIDAKNIDGVLGCIAGDDTVFLAIAQSAYAERIMGEIKNADEHAH